MLAALLDEREDLLVLAVDMSVRANAEAFPGVTSVPRLEVYRAGERTWRGRGFTPPDRLRELIEDA